MHGDLRPDNFLGSYVIDWANGCRGPRSFDVLFLGAALEGLGQQSLLKTIALFEEAENRSFEKHDLQVMAAHLSGYFADQVYRQVPEKMPRLRWMQKIMLLSLVRYLADTGALPSNLNP